MVTIEIDYYVQAVFEKSWDLFDVKGKKHLVKMLEDDILERSIEVIEDAEKILRVMFQVRLNWKMEKSETDNQQ